MDFYGDGVLQHGEPGVDHVEEAQQSVSLLRGQKSVLLDFGGTGSHALAQDRAS